MSFTAGPVRHSPLNAVGDPIVCVVGWQAQWRGGVGGLERERGCPLRALTLLEDIGPRWETCVLGLLEACMGLVSGSALSLKHLCVSAFSPALVVTPVQALMAYYVRYHCDL